MILQSLLQQNEKNLPDSDLLVLIRSYQVLASEDYLWSVSLWYLLVFTVD